MLVGVDGGVAEGDLGGPEDVAEHKIPRQVK